MIYKVIIAGSRDFDDYKLLCDKEDREEIDSKISDSQVCHECDIEECDGRIDLTPDILLDKIGSLETLRHNLWEENQMLRRIILKYQLAIGFFAILMVIIAILWFIK